jgi:hypothetical protein
MIGAGWASILLAMMNTDPIRTTGDKHKYQTIETTGGNGDSSGSSGRRERNTAFDR